jgi:NADH:ubiquinone oxidoreductase subunit C
MIDKKKFSRGVGSIDSFFFIIFENQSIIKFFQKRNYRHTTYYMLDTLYYDNWLFWKKHSGVSPMYHLDIVTYSNNTSMLEVTKPFFFNRHVTFYKFFSLIFNRHVLLTGALDVKLGGLANLWPSASFYEREVCEMFGIYKIGAPDQRRLLLDYSDFSNPMRREYNVYGSKEIRYSKFTDAPKFIPNTLNTL